MSQCHRSQNVTFRRFARVREERGQSLVEFAIVLPVLLLFILGIIYFGRFEDYSNQATQLAEQGARFAAVNNNPGASLTPAQTLQAYVQAQAQPELQAGSSDVSAAKVFIYYPTGSSNVIGNPVRVCVVTTVSFPSPLGTPSTTVAQTATMRIEQLQTSAVWTPDSAPTASAAGCSIS